MIALGLIGWPVSHSLSPKLHNAALQANGIMGEYCLYPINPQEPEKLLNILSKVRSGEITGLNVTIPLKQSVIPLMDELTDTSRSIGAVNTIYSKDGRLYGHNTDAPGFTADLKENCVFQNYSGKKVIVLGAGGSARAVVWALRQMSCLVTIASRDPAQGRSLIGEFQRHSNNMEINSISLDHKSLKPLLGNTNIVINTTPVGMFPNINESPWPNGLPLPGGAFIYDLIYNPSKTNLVTTAHQMGLRAVNGLGMLVEQAALAFEIWTGISAPRNVMVSAVKLNL